MLSLLCALYFSGSFIVFNAIGVILAIARAILLLRELRSKTA